MADELELRIRFVDHADGFGTHVAELQSLTGEELPEVLRRAVLHYRIFLNARARGSRVFVLDQDWTPVAEWR